MRELGMVLFIGTPWLQMAVEAVKGNSALDALMASVATVLLFLVVAGVLSLLPSRPIRRKDA